MDERIERIAGHYGYKNQKMILIEKMGELMQAIGKFDRAEKAQEIRSTGKAIEEKLVDVQIMIDQIRFLRGMPPEDFGEIYNYKLDRQIERLADEEMVYVIGAVHHDGGKEYLWRLPEVLKTPSIGDIVPVQSKDKITHVLVKRVFMEKKKNVRNLKVVMGGSDE